MISLSGLAAPPLLVPPIDVYFPTSVIYTSMDDNYRVYCSRFALRSLNKAANPRNCFLSKARVFDFVYAMDTLFTFSEGYVIRSRLVVIERVIRRYIPTCVI